MSTPSDPNKVIIKNDYYKDGLTSGEIYKYYEKNMYRILSNVSKNPVIIFMNIDGKEVVKRNDEGSKIILTSQNYYKFINGYVTSISVETPSETTEWIIDVDAKKEGILEEDKKIVVKNIINKVKNMNNIKYIKTSNSSSGYHIHCFLKERMNIYQSYLSLKLLFSNIQERNGVKVDLSPMKNGGSCTVVGSLNKNGLKCDWIDDVDKYNRKKSVISI